VQEDPVEKATWGKTILLTGGGRFHRLGVGGSHHQRDLTAMIETLCKSWLGIANKLLDRAAARSSA
jgi:hypothetical protein